MRAVRVHEFGGPDVLQVEEVPQPEPVPGEVLVRVQAAGVNPYESYVREGRYTELPALPYTPGGDGAGVRTDTGERVYLTGSLSGTYADYALCVEEDVRPLPDDLSYAQGAAVGVPYHTAFRALVQRAGAAAGERVLIHGASGGVGIATVQLALAAGLDVTGTAGSEAGRELVAGQGDVRVLDHRDPDHFAQALELTDGRGFDLIIEFLANANLGKDLRALAQRGRVVVVGSRGAVEVDARDLMNAEGAILGMRTPNARRDEEVAARAAVDAGLRSGVLKPVVGRELPLAEAARAHRLIMERPALGKLVLVP
jgi:NADPH:quinone reductase